MPPAYCSPASTNILAGTLQHNLATYGLRNTSGEKVNVSLDFKVQFANSFPNAIPAHERQKAACCDQVLAVRLGHRSLLLSVLDSDHGPCPGCFDSRWKALQPVAEQKASAEGQQLQFHFPYLTSFAAGQIWNLIRELFRHRDRTQNSTRSVYRFDFLTHEVEVDQLIADSLCPLCKSPQPDSANGAELQLRANLKPRRGKTRLKSIHEYNINTNAFINPICGVLGGASVREMDQSITATVSGKCFDAGSLSETIHWSGHAASYKDSLLIGILEGLERQSGGRCRRKTPVVFNSFSNLQDMALDPSTCGLLESVYYQDNPRLTPYHPDLKMSWVWGYSLISSQPVLVPKQLGYYADGAGVDQRFMDHTSSGCAAGSCIEEAILRGLLELIERDSFVISWYARLCLPRIDPWSCPDSKTLFLLDRMERMNWEICLLDSRLDMNIPSVVSVIRRRDRELGSLLIGAGANIDASEAIRSALHEAGSFMMHFQNRVVAEEKRIREMAEDYTLVTDLVDHALLYGLPEMADRMSFFYSCPIMRSFAESYEEHRRFLPSGDIALDLARCITELRSCGLNEMIVVDQTSPEQDGLGIKTVCVIVPGLLPIDFGYNRRRALSLPRLMSAPVRAGFPAFDKTAINAMPHAFA